MARSNQIGNGTGRVRQDVSLDCVDASGTIRVLEATLGYRSDDPYAVTLTFRLPGGDVVWAFARELLSAGLSAPVGNGDVHIWPCLDRQQRAVVVIELTSPEGQLIAQARSATIFRFLARAHAIVPPGSESGQMDIDGLLADLLSDAA